VEELEQRKQKPVPAPLYSLYMQAIDRKERDIVRQQRVIAAQVKAVERARQHLTERVRERKVMEKARERDQEKYLRGVLQEEQKASDEQMVLRFNRHGSRLAR
jgi:flagellar export protein FliJ